MNIQITSPAFKEGEMIPSKYTCDGKNISPPLEWSGAPVNTKSFALIMDDPDAPGGTFVHWVIYNIPASQQNLSENIPAVNKLSNGILQGKNSAQRIGYFGPCPPGGIHRYIFKLYCLDTNLNLVSGITKADLLKAMEGHILVQCQLMGTYTRK
jgi:Raf kinase inhibitor-like YbhB/YbcL family protein